MAQTSPLPSLPVLRSFEAAARHQSFTMAAEELGLTQGAISRQVRELEEFIGARLFARVGRSVQLTQAGRGFARDLGGDLARLRQSVTRAVAAGDGGSILSVAVLPTFGSRWLMPRLPDFCARHPDIQLSFSSRGEPFDLQEARCDVAIHFGRADWPGAQLTPLCPENLRAVAAPAFIERHGIQRPADLCHAPLLQLSSRPDAWAGFFAAQAQDATRAGAGMLFDQFSLMISAALQGLGAALLPVYLIEDELSQGSLCAVAAVGSPLEASYHIATPLGGTSREAASFVSWLRRQVPRRRAA